MMMNKKMEALVVCFFVLIATTNAFSENEKHLGDSHYTASGFFDVHVCNWPDRAPFYMILYSTMQFNDIKSVEIMNGSDERLADLDLSKFKIINLK